MVILKICLNLYFELYCVMYCLLCVLCILYYIVLCIVGVYCWFWHPSSSGSTRITFLDFSILIMEDSEHFSKEQSSVQPLSDLNQKFSFMKAPSNRSIILPGLALSHFTPVGSGYWLEILWTEHCVCVFWSVHDLHECMFCIVCLCVYCRVCVLWGEQRIPMVRDWWCLWSSLDNFSLHLLLLLCLHIVFTSSHRGKQCV